MVTCLLYYALFGWYQGNSSPGQLMMAGGYCRLSSSSFVVPHDTDIGTS